MYTVVCGTYCIPFLGLPAMVKAPLTRAMMIEVAAALFLAERFLPDLTALWNYPALLEFHPFMFYNTFSLYTYYLVQYNN